MFCRFCGKEIRKDSSFCAFCGKAQNTQKGLPFPTTKFSHKEIDVYTLSTIASICFFVGLFLFYILYMKMAPGIGGDKLISYFVGAATVTVAAVIVRKVQNGEMTKSRQYIALVFGLLLLIPSSILRIVYECKVDAAVSDIPATGTICIALKTDEEFYSYFESGYVRNPFSNVTLDGCGGNTQYVKLNKPYSVEITAGHEGKDSGSVRQATGSVRQASSGSKTIEVTFTQSNIKDGYTVMETVSLSDGLVADVTVKFTRVCPFWDVIRY